MFLTADEIEALTGYKKPKLQRRWLLDNGYRFEVRADGRPAVLASAVTARLDARARKPAAEPNWEALR